jgi:small subunit ribosomal protein S10
MTEKIIKKQTKAKAKAKAKVITKVKKTISVKTKKTPIKKSPVVENKKNEVINTKNGIQKLRIKIFAYEYKILDATVKQIIDLAFRHDADIRGPVPLPVSIKKYTVNRSTFVHKNAREQFEARIHKRLIDILEPNKKLVDSLMNFSLPTSVKVDVKLL